MEVSESLAGPFSPVCHSFIQAAAPANVSVLLGRLGLRLEVGKALQFVLTLSKHFDVYP